jgi:hypothetical protein
VPPHELPMASSFLSVSQNVGGSLGIALLNSYVTNSIQIHMVRMGEVFPVESQRFIIRFGHRVMSLVFRHEPGLVAFPAHKIAFAVTQDIALRAQVLGYNNGFVLAGLIVLAGIPLALLLKPSAHHLKNAAKAKAVAE